MPDNLIYGTALLLLAAWGFLFYFLTHPRPDGQVTSWRARRRGRISFGKASAPSTFNVEQQLRIVAAASFERRRLLSASEYRVFKIIEEELAAARRGHRVFAQTSLGEILASLNEDAFRSIN